MDLTEFTEFVLSLVNKDEFPVREIPMIFNSSMRLQIDEITSDAHNCMQLIEFLEGLCRVVDLASPIPQGESQVNIIY
jgi:hypothetical protein